MDHHKYSNPKLMSGIMMKGSPNFLSKDDDIQNLMISNFLSRNRYYRGN
jgi:hypothetical protein